MAGYCIKHGVEIFSECRQCKEEREAEDYRRREYDREREEDRRAYEEHARSSASSYSQSDSDDEEIVLWTTQDLDKYINGFSEEAFAIETLKKLSYATDLCDFLGTPGHIFSKYEAQPVRKTGVKSVTVQFVNGASDGADKTIIMEVLGDESQKAEKMIYRVHQRVGKGILVNNEIWKCQAKTDPEYGLNLIRFYIPNDTSAAMRIASIWAQVEICFVVPDGCVWKEEAEWSEQSSNEKDAKNTESEKDSYSSKSWKLLKFCLKWFVYIFIGSALLAGIFGGK